MLILHLPDVVGGHATSLSRAESRMGHASSSMSYVQSPYDYQPDFLLKNRNAGFVARWSERLATFWRIRNAFDVFHFNFGRTLLSPASGRFTLPDLPYYGSNAVKVMTFQGSDARIGYGPELEQSIEAESAIGSGFDRAVWTEGALALARERKLEIMAKAARHCDALMALNPDLLAGMDPSKSSFFPYAIELPTALQGEYRPPMTDLSKPMHIVHLSTNRLLKGTGLIEKALAEAKGNAANITWDIVVKKPRPDALKALASADLVIDQMVLGWYGAAAVESCYLGKPVISFLSSGQKAGAPTELLSDLAFIEANPDKLAMRICELEADRHSLVRFGLAGQAFAVKWHDPDKVAARSLSLYAELLHR